jgi:hypothetical protein
MAKNLNIDWRNIEEIKGIISSVDTRTKVLKRLGYTGQSLVAREKLNLFIKSNNVDTSHFGKISDKWKILPSIITECYSYADILKRLNLSAHGAGNKTAKRYVKYYNLDISHFYSNNNGIVGGSDPKYTDDQVFCQNSKANRGIVRLRYTKKRTETYKCDCCGLSTWLDQKIKLEIDHIDGNPTNHTLTNLRLLCPNCHSLTETYGNKKRVDTK